LTSGALGATPPANDGTTAAAATEAPATEAQQAAGTAQPSTTTTSTPTTTTPAPPPTATSTTPQASTPAAAEAEAPTVVLQRKQKATPSGQANPSITSTTAQEATGKTSAAKKESAPNNVASSPQAVAQAGALAAMLASSEASDQALAFYRIPLFLLPIYKAAAVQYGVPWQILAAINEIETDYGSDQSVSTAGAVGWMQFMPSTWLQYGVDALNAGYADPYNPVDAIFAAARYLRAAGAATDLHAAILAYNHSEEYVESVLLRAKLISSYPKNVIATLTGLIDGRLPVTGKQVAWTPLPASSLSPATATGSATAVAPSQAAGAATGSASGASSAGASVPGSSAAPAPTAAAAAATSGAGASAAVQPLQLIDLRSAPTASVVAVQDGRVVQIGNSHKLGRFLVLRDVYGDVFTYAGLGSIAPTYTLPKESASIKTPVVEAASTSDPAPTLPASAGTQSPLTLSVKTPHPPATAPSGAGHVSLPAGSEETSPGATGKVRVFAHPGNPDARAAALANVASKARRLGADQRMPLHSGSVVASGTVLGRVHVLPGAQDGHLRFAIRPAGDSSTIDPGPVLANWAQLQAALHPQGATATNALLGATASDVFLLSKAQLQRTVLSDPGITVNACERHDIASGAVDRRVLAMLAFLSRSGLKPTVSALRCGQGQYAPSGASSAAYTGDAVDISAINGTPIASHQGPGTITDLTIRALLTLPTGFVPHEIVSLMRYPGAPNTHAKSAYWNHIHLDFRHVTAAAQLKHAAAATVAHSARAGRIAPPPIVTTNVLSTAQWNQLMTRVGALPIPAIAAKPSSAAVPDPKKHR